MAQEGSRAVATGLCVFPETAAQHDAGPPQVNQHECLRQSRGNLTQARSASEGQSLTGASGLYHCPRYFFRSHGFACISRVRYRRT